MPPHLNPMPSPPPQSSFVASPLHVPFVCQDTPLWTPTLLSQLVKFTAESLFHIAVDTSVTPNLVESHTRAGQYLKLRVSNTLNSMIFAIPSSPKLAFACGAFEFSVKNVKGSTAEVLCVLKRGDVVELSSVMGNGFDIIRLDSLEKFDIVTVFATSFEIRSAFYFNFAILIFHC
ncbi:fruit protein pKIWI502-like [Arachis stenosperma]|uniref:fruit protein pKIWI502-like n=1 Tax=Arachis stenosperma TaxID=217475 RepID=UPI0025AB83CA|nr:fruit protein pKIWI502-like [Arachis stenosperma]